MQYEKGGKCVRACVKERTETRRRYEGEKPGDVPVVRRGHANRFLLPFFFFFLSFTRLVSRSSERVNSFFVISFPALQMLSLPPFLSVRQPRGQIAKRCTKDPVGFDSLSNGMFATSREERFLHVKYLYRSRKRRAAIRRGASRQTYL
ncbi:hypothetical protein PUN28_016395 [Cardiocondyla obscurior]|uniref:Transmembrane protein n=1 Tax=Cardiocondyla obscurior TaxID=286306 RepID=A0AAW2ER59_9HYME